MVLFRLREIGLLAVFIGLAVGCSNPQPGVGGTGPERTGPNILKLTPGPNMEGYATVDTGGRWKLGAPQVPIPEGEIGVGRWLEGPDGEGLNINLRVKDPRAPILAQAEADAKTKKEMEFTRSGGLVSWRQVAPGGVTLLIMHRPSQSTSIYAAAYFKKPPTQAQIQEAVRLVESIEAK